MPIRKSYGILSNNINSNYETDASIIVTAATLGLCYSLLKENKPIQFDDDDPVNMPKLRDCVTRINKVLKNYDSKLKNFVTVGTALPYSENKIISGSLNQEYMSIENRKNSIRSGRTSPPQGIIEIASDEKNPLGYRGPGAYTGCVMSNQNHFTFSATTRYNVPTDDNVVTYHANNCISRTNRGERWIPQVRKNNYHPSIPWGIINYKNIDTRIDTMQTIEYNTDAKIVGYTHGMIQAIYTVLANKVKGYDNTNPFEIAVGSKTTKLASCLGCTLFMYANNYIPSSMHLGASSSWAPLYPYHKTGSVYKPSLIVDSCIEIANLDWDRYCYECIMTGRQILMDARNWNLINNKPDYYNSVDALNQYCNENALKKFFASNLILDAFTIHIQAREHILKVLNA